MNSEIAEVAKLSSLVAVPMFVLEIGRDDHLRFCNFNKAASETSGIAPEQVLGKTAAEIWSKRTSVTISHNFSTCLKNRLPFTYDEILEFPAGTISWRTTLTPVLDGDEPVGIVGVAIDITAEKKLEADYARTLSEIGRINGDLQVLVSATAHDLRGPLRQAKLLNEMICEDFEDLGDKKLQLLMMSGDLLSKAIGQIDEKMEEVKTPLEAEWQGSRIDFAHWCRDIFALLDPMSRLSVSYPHVEVHMESFILDVGLRNLLDNACRFASSRIDIDISASNDELVITISDDGNGFAKGFSIVEPLADETSVKSGFGLLATKRLIEARGGRLWVSSPHRDLCGGSIAFSISGKVVS